jgi:hypothetical protein
MQKDTGLIPVKKRKVSKSCRDYKWTMISYNRLGHHLYQIQVPITNVDPIIINQLNAHFPPDGELIIMNLWNTPSLKNTNTINYIKHLQQTNPTLEGVWIRGYVKRFTEYNKNDVKPYYIVQDNTDYPYRKPRLLEPKPICQKRVRKINIGP